jgi:hypothetical protein
MNEQKDLEAIVRLLKTDGEKVHLVLNAIYNYGESVIISEATARTIYGLLKEDERNQKSGCQRTIARLAKKAGLNEEAKRHYAAALKNACEVDNPQNFRCEIPASIANEAEMTRELFEYLLKINWSKAGEHGSWCLNHNLVSAGHLSGMEVEQVIDFCIQKDRKDAALSIARMEGYATRQGVRERRLTLNLENQDYYAAYFCAKELGKKETEEYFEKAVEKMIKEGGHIFSLETLARELESRGDMTRAIILYEKTRDVSLIVNAYKKAGMLQKALDTLLSVPIERTGRREEAYKLAKEMELEQTARKCFEEIRDYYIKAKFGSAVAKVADTMSSDEEEKNALYKTALKIEFEKAVQGAGNDAYKIAKKYHLGAELVELYETSGRFTSALHTASEEGLAEKVKGLAPKAVAQYEKEGDLYSAARTAKANGLDSTALYTKIAEGLIQNLKFKEAHKAAVEGNLTELAEKLKAWD